MTTFTNIDPIYLKLRNGAAVKDRLAFIKETLDNADPLDTSLFQSGCLPRVLSDVLRQITFVSREDASFLNVDVVELPSLAPFIAIMRAIIPVEDTPELAWSFITRCIIHTPIATKVSKNSVTVTSTKQLIKPV